MIVNIYITMIPGADRPYVGTVPPAPSFTERAAGTKVFRAEVELADYDKVDGVISSVPAKLLPPQENPV